MAIWSDNGSIIVLIDSTPSLEKVSLMSSWTKTLFVKHLVKSVKFLFLNVRNLDLVLFSIVSKSLALSKLFIASTLCLSLNSNMLPTSKTTSWLESNVFPAPTFVVESIDESAKFYKPDGWTNLLTGFTNLSQSTELFIEYDKFW